jgi:hypothetical protein
VLSLPQPQPQPLQSLLLVPTRRKKRKKRRTRKKRREEREERDLENYREGINCYRRHNCRRRNI